MTTKEKSQISRAVQIASAKELNAQALAAFRAQEPNISQQQGSTSKLRTEKDGRRFAVRSLRALERLDYASQFKRLGDQQTVRLFDSWSAKAESEDTEDPGVMMIARAGPQTPVLKDAFDKIYHDGTEEARRGFFVVMTDYIGATVCGAGIPDISRYQRDDECQPWGSANYRNPKAAARAIAKGKEVYRFRPLTKAEKRTAAKEKSAARAAEAQARRKAKLQRQLRDLARRLSELDHAAE
jgi:hypothetical protein